MLNDLLKSWNHATAELPWGVQRTVHQALSLVSEGSVSICYNADYREGSPCLINAVGQQLAVGGGNGIPMNHFGRLVGLFDRINSSLESSGVNENGILSPLGADVLLKNFAPLKEVPEPTAEDAKPVIDAPYIEPTDAQVAEMMTALNGSAVVPDIVDQYVNSDDFFAGYAAAVNDSPDA